MKVTFRVPSKRTTYGAVEIEMELPDYELYKLGTIYQEIVDEFHLKESPNG